MTPTTNFQKLRNSIISNISLFGYVRYLSVLAIVAPIIADVGENKKVSIILIYSISE